MRYGWRWLFSQPYACCQPSLNTILQGIGPLPRTSQKIASLAAKAFLEKTGEDQFTGEVTARQSCPMLEEDYLVRQDCALHRMLGNQLSVRCRIVEFVNGNESPFYYPDNFTLTIESAARMHGALVSSGTGQSPQNGCAPKGAFLDFI